MRAILQTATDVASLCFFDPAALPKDFDAETICATEDGKLAFMEKGLLWCTDTGADGGYLFHFYVDEDIPERIRQHSLDPIRMESFKVPSGVIWACGAEYASIDPGEKSLKKFPHMGQNFSLQTGEYALEAWRTEWPDGMIEDEIRKRCGKGDSKRMRMLGPIAGAIFVVGAVLAFVMVLLTLPSLLSGRWNMGFTCGWIGVGILSAAVLLTFRKLSRMEKNPERLAAEREFPSIVVQMRKTA
jgi:hypothetical protein